MCQGGLLLWRVLGIVCGFLGCVGVVLGVLVVVVGGDVHCARMFLWVCYGFVFYIHFKVFGAVCVRHMSKHWL